MLDKYDALALLKQELLLEVDIFLSKERDMRAPTVIQALSDAIMALIQYTKWVEDA